MSIHEISLRKDNHETNRENSAIHAGATAHADYNGHHITAYWNEYRCYYVCEHQWGERVVHARGDVRYVLKAAIQEYSVQGLGASLSVTVKPQDAAIALELGLVAGKEPSCDWWTWKHSEAAMAYRVERTIGLPYLKFLFEATSKADYDARIVQHCRMRKSKPLLTQDCKS